MRRGVWRDELRGEWRGELRHEKFGLDDADCGDFAAIVAAQLVRWHALWDEIMVGLDDADCGDWAAIVAAVDEGSGVAAGEGLVVVAAAAFAAVGLFGSLALEAA